VIGEKDLEQAERVFVPPNRSFDGFLRRRDRKRRNQRIAAGVVGIAVFVAAVWIVTSGLSFDRTQTPAATGPAATGPAETGPVGRPAPPLLHASAAPDVVSQRPCSGDARSRLELTGVGQQSSQVWIRVRFEVYRSPVGHRWRIAIRPGGVGGPHPGSPIFRGIRVAGDSGQLAVQLRVLDEMGSTFPNPFGAVAVDTQTGEECRVGASIDP
jgi:hypothetical protein